MILDLIPFRSYSRPEILDLIPFRFPHPGRLSKWSGVVQSGVLAEVGKKRNTDDDFPPH